MSYGLGYINIDCFEVDYTKIPVAKAVAKKTPMIDSLVATIAGMMEIALAHLIFPFPSQFFPSSGTRGTDPRSPQSRVYTNINPLQGTLSSCLVFEKLI
jgi:hypothetical protein